MFDVGLPEIGVIVLVAIIMFGPDRLPEFARQAGRLVQRLRDLATNAQADLRRELGPEFADLNLADLNPRAALRKHVLEALEAEPEPLQPNETPPWDSEAT